MKTIAYLCHHNKYDILKISFLFLTTVILVLSLSKSAVCDDIELYGTVTVAIEPNVMIVFDTSGSMATADVVAEAYNPSKIYKNVTKTATFNTDAVYYQTATSTSLTSWTTFAVTANNIICAAAKEELVNNRIWIGRLVTSASKRSDCSTTETNRRWVTGNYRNYLTIPNRTREDVAKEVVYNLINDTDNVRFGLFVFNGNDGGKLVQPCGASKNTLLSSVNSIKSSGNTPLAETLAEVGLYFAGMQSWFQTKVKYETPIQYRCQKNYVIYMTDGEPTQDNDTKLWTKAYINGDIIGDYDKDGDEPSKSPSKMTYLDDVAAYLFNEDVNPTIGYGTSLANQHIITYTIGFKSDQPLLQKAADQGGGAYYTADDTSALSTAFQEIMSNISEQNASFVSPVVPVDKLNKTYSGNSIYMGFFRPQQTGVWNGNIKKYGIDSAGNIIDRNSNIATDAAGRLKTTTQSYWSSSADGSNVAAGGVGEKLASRSTPRNIYTYMGQQKSLVHSTNNFALANNLLQPATFNLATSTQRDTLISLTRAETRPWPLRDILHSDPVVAHYNTNESYIFVGSNGGMMHCFRDSDGAEMWGYIPSDLFSRLHLLNAGEHNYFVDGTPVIYNGPSQKILFFGERRGGSHYTALDVTNPSSPSFLYTITPNLLGGGNSTLGQSWGQPELSKIRTASGIDTVFILPGGYDEANQDLDIPAATDTVGKAVFSVKASDGSLSSLSFHAKNFSQMTHSIVDVSAFDSNGYGYIDKVYAGDMAGNVFAMRETARGSWEVRKLFSSSAVDGIRKKIFYAPDATKETYGENIFFGTGDRENPSKISIQNRIYSVKNNWVNIKNINDFETITESHLVDVTSNLIQLGTAEEKSQTEKKLNDSKGWFIRLEHTGEKVVSSPVVFAGVVYFTTYTPVDEVATPAADPCMTSDTRGTARLYALDYKTGASVINFSNQSEIDNEGNIVVLGKEDRSTNLGTSIPSAPVIVIHEGGPHLYVGVEGGINTVDPLASPTAKTYYWRQMLN